MNRVLIESGFRVTMPKEVRGGLKVGDEVIVSVDRAGRIVLLSAEQVRTTLQRTAGLWRGRTDIPDDGVKFVNRLRQGRRLRRLGVTNHAPNRH
jgi:bifunctional DNA-binding transcriptional regulator/antitoxin component of YhaV-PrlF toxin-antitoxin module